MSAFDLDQLIEQAATIGEVAAGGDRQVLAARGADPRLLTTASRATKPQAARWSETDEQFVRDHWGELAISEIAAALGRTWNAVKVHTIRDMHLRESPYTKRPQIVTCNVLAAGLGRDVHQVSEWLDDGRLPAHIMPCRGGRRIRIVQRLDVVRFAANPVNWILFNINDINRSRQKVHREREIQKYDYDWWEKLRALVLRRKQLWPDEWWTPGQVARYHGVSHSQINCLIHEGQLPGIKYGNWHVLRSDALKLQRPVEWQGKGGMGQDHYRVSPNADAFLVLATAAGQSLAAIEAMGSGFNPKQTPYRINVLRQRGKLPWIVKHNGLPVVFNKRGDMLADWKDLKHRFPRLARTMYKLRRQETLSPHEVLLVRAVLYTWARFFARNKEQRAIVTSLNSVCKRQARHFYALVRRMRAAGIDPYRKLEKQL